MNFEIYVNIQNLNIQIKTNKYIFFTNDLHNYRNLITQNLNDSNSLKHEKMKCLSVLNFKGFILQKNILSRIFFQNMKDILNLYLIEDI